MPHKDPEARAKYWADYYANPENQAKNVAHVKRWRKKNPAKFRKQARRVRQAARDRETVRRAQKVAARLLVKAAEAARAVIKQRETQGYVGTPKPNHF